MYINKCTKCGAEFETKNPKRVICPNCLYPDKKLSPEAPSVEPSESSQQQQQEYPTNYSSGSYDERPSRRYENNSYSERPQGYGNRDRGYNSGYNRPQRNYDNNSYNRERSGYDNRGMNSDRPQRSYDNRGGYGGQRSHNNNRSGGYGSGYGGNRGGYNNDRRPKNFSNNRRPKQGGFNKKRPQPQRNKQLLVSREQIEQIEIMYKKALPLPNHDIHEVIGQALEIEPRKVFFGINYIRQKMMLPKLPFPKRKLAVTPDQLTAIKALYEPLLPLPPIGCHKIIAAQLKMDEWRVHVGIGLVRKQMGLDRWNPDRPDAPAEYKTSK